MRTCRDLPRLGRQALYRFNSLRRAFDRAGLPDVRDDVRKKVIATITIDAVNTWANFSRAYFLSCCVGARLPGHGRVSTTVPFTNLNDSIVWATQSCRPRVGARLGTVVGTRDEPKWHILSNLLNSCSAVGVSHYAQMTAAVSIPSRVFSDLVVFRNYFGHKNRVTENAVKNIASLSAVPSALSPCEILMQKPLRRPEPLLKFWIRDLEDVIYTLCN